MKVFRDVFAAVLIGIMGGFIVTTISYYNNHKEGGVLQTLLAVSDSFKTVAESYSGVDSDNLLGKEDYNFEDKVLAAFNQIENGEAESVSDALLKSIFNKNDMEENDILAMDGEDGNLDEGSPYTGIMRFHVRANSDTAEDQALKMAVKEDVVTMLKPLLADCKDVKESKNLIVSNMDKIYKTAVNTVVEQGYNYEIKVYVTEEQFPAKTYGDLTFPEGRYQALRVDIGAAKGQNWWCVMFPPLCFVDESTAVVSSESKEELKEALTPEEYAALFAYSKDGKTPEGEQVEVKGESMLYNWIKSRTKER